MNLKVYICRTARIPTNYLKGCCGADENDAPNQVYAKLLEHYGPLAPGVNFYVEQGKSLVTKEVMSFNVQAADIPFAGVSTADMLSEREIDRMDGALESELSRMGITSEPDEYEWRVLYRGQRESDK